MKQSSDCSSLQLTTTQWALSEAETVCQQRGVRLTELRRRVLEIIWNHSSPLGAYAILDVLRNDGRQGAPPTVYRALDFLLEQGFIHRLASLNVFTGCRQPGAHHSGQFLICRDCGQVDELSNLTVDAALRAEAMARDFEVSAQTVEVLGRCLMCRNEASHHAN
ncbi:MAG TPA: Fur family transcriptional regulator [Candidatus Competibacteraceae bacterium]|nr:Fur family transcriptional regulator [Candidatus Competibacteraceae bacterium]